MIKMGYLDITKTCENFAEEFFKRLEPLILISDTFFFRIKALITEYKTKMLGDIDIGFSDKSEL